MQPGDDSVTDRDGKGLLRMLRAVPCGATVKSLRHRMRRLLQGASPRSLFTLSAN